MRKLVLILAIAGMICFPALAGAVTISYNANPIVPSTTTDWDFAPALGFTQFNPALGTLSSVQIELFASMDTQLSITNNSATETSDGTAITRVRLYATSAGGSIPEALKMTVFIPDLDGFAFSLAPGATVLTPVMNQNGSSDNTYTDAAQLAEFTGLGIAYLNAYTITATILEYTAGNISADQTTHADLTGRVTYEYSDVPIPPTALLLGSGLLGLGLLRRKFGLKK